MDKLNLYQRSFLFKREANEAVLRVGAQVATLASAEDWQAWLIDSGAKSIDGRWVRVMSQGVLVELHVATMTLMCNKGGGDNATARLLLDYSQHSNFVEALEGKNE